MHLTEDNLKIFGFTEVEAKVLMALLEIGSARVSRLSRRADVPRTTVYSALLRLKDRGFVKETSKGHFQRYWRMVRLTKLKHLAKQSIEEFDVDRGISEDAPADIIEGIDAEEVGITVYRGKLQIKKAYELMLDLSKTERVYVIQGNRSAQSALKHLERQYILDFTKGFKKSGIIMEAINGEGVLPLFRGLDTDVLKSHWGRLVVGLLLPDKYLDFGIDIIIFRDTVLLGNIEEEFVVFIKNKAIVDAFSHICLLLQDSGRQFDLNAYVKNLIEERKRV